MATCFGLYSACLRSLDNGLAPSVVQVVFLARDGTSISASSAPHLTDNGCPACQQSRHSRLTFICYWNGRGFADHKHFVGSYARQIVPVAQSVIIFAGATCGPQKIGPSLSGPPYQEIFLTWLPDPCSRWPKVRSEIWDICGSCMPVMKRGLRGGMRIQNCKPRD
jgi:hypothetical protein